VIVLRDREKRRKLGVIVLKDREKRKKLAMIVKIGLTGKLPGNRSGRSGLKEGADVAV
jgi:hypothetical protein